MGSELLQAMDTLRERIDLSIEDLVGLVARWTPAVAARQSRHKVTEIPTERTIRYYVSVGLVDRPLRYDGTRALYGFHQSLQALSIKALQARYFPLRKIRSVISDRTDLELEGILRRIEGEPADGGGSDPGGGGEDLGRRGRGRQPRRRGEEAVRGVRLRTPWKEPRRRCGDSGSGTRS